MPLQKVGQEHMKKTRHALFLKLNTPHSAEKNRTTPPAPTTVTMQRLSTAYLKKAVTMFWI
jgi:hypothetical protein